MWDELVLALSISREDGHKVGAYFQTRGLVIFFYFGGISRGCRGLFPNWWSAAEVTLLTSYMTHNHQPDHDEEDDDDHQDAEEDDDDDHCGLIPLLLTSSPLRCHQAQRS